MCLSRLSPASTAIKEEATSATAAPKKTMCGDLERAESVITINCVLSPNSARKTTLKAINADFQSNPGRPPALRWSAA